MYASKTQGSMHIRRKNKSPRVSPPLNPAPRYHLFEQPTENAPKTPTALLFPVFVHFWQVVLLFTIWFDSMNGGGTAGGEFYADATSHVCLVFVCVFVYPIYAWE